MTRSLAGISAVIAVGVLARPSVAGAAGGERLRGEARSILSEQRFHTTRLPRPLHGLFARLGEWLAPVGRLIDRVVRWLVGVLPGGRFTLWPVLAGLVLLAVLVLTRRSVRRRARAEQAAQAQDRALAVRAEDPDELERRAETAAREGDLDGAVRLRFRAGLMRLDARRAIALRPSLTTGEVARTLRSPVFAELAGTFEEVAYGGRAAHPEEVEAARSGWPRILEEVRSE